MADCIYCGSLAESLEHPLPAAFGEFEHAPLLENVICGTCNNILGLNDEQFSRCGPEALLRRYFKIQGRRQHEKVNPHYRRSAGGGRLKTTAYDSSLDAEVEIEFMGGQEGRQLCQLVIKEDDGTSHLIPIPPDLTDPIKIREQFDNLPIRDRSTMSVTFVSYPDEADRIVPLLRQVWPQLTFGPATPGATVSSGVVTEINLTSRYFRAIAKIAFHYFLTQFPHINGADVCFDEIRRFIISDQSTLDDAKKLIGRRAAPLLGNMRDGSQPDGWVAHILTAEMSGNEYLGHVQMFVSRDYPSQAYTVTLASGQRSIVTGTGHGYRYFPDEQRGRYIGEARPLRATFNPFPKQALLPLFG
jgi:hypothetical protein